MYSLKDYIKVNEMTSIGEKYLNNSEVTKLINHTEDAVNKLLRDPKKSSEDNPMQEKSFNGFKMLE